MKTDLSKKDRWYWLRLSFGAIGWFIYPVFIQGDGPPRQSWSEFKIGMKKHKCEFTDKVVIKGYRFFQCKHYGCNVLEPID